MLPSPCVWVFNGSGGRFPGGVFSDIEKARAWIAAHGLTGVLTSYPLDEGCFDWAVANGCANLSAAGLRSKAADPGFIGSFSSAFQEHVHFEDGRPSS